MPTDLPTLDEMVDGQGGVRPHWRELLSRAYSLGRDGLIERRALLARAASDEGFAGLLPGARTLSWHCDPLPLPLPAAEFEALSSGLAQRGRLLEAVLADLYGPQRLLAEGVLPPGLVYANPGFLRPCATVAGQPPPLLHAYAVDLVRGLDGSWQVCADLLSRPAGAAFALENRRMLSRLCPELFRTQAIGRLSPFFEAWQEALRRLAPASLANPGIALLTAGHREPLWSEHVLLARELSCALVESGDLTVRAGRLFLKTLSGLTPVDVLLRRVDGGGLDPLELAAETAHGLPGLFDAQRAGNVRIASDPGVGMLEAPGFAAFLPRLAQALLGETLALPAIETLWLGDPANLRRVQAAPEGWLLRSALEAAGEAASESADGHAAAWAGLSGERSWRFVASARPTPSVAPCIGPEGMEPRAVVLRLFAIRDESCRGGWRVMQGGLARTLPEGEPFGSTLARHTLAKDVWVLLEEVTEIAGPAPLATPPLLLRRSQGELPARVADNFFWLGRHLERFEGEARLVRTALLRLARAAMTPRERVELQVLTERLVQGGLIAAEQARGAGRSALLRALLDAGGPEGVLRRQSSRVMRLVELLRDQLTGTMYSASGALLRDVDAEFGRIAGAGEGPRLDHLLAATRGVLDVAAMIAGLSAENMVIGGGRLFLDLGRRLERAETIAAEVAAALSPREGASRLAPIETGLRLLLELRDSVITYRARYLTTLQPAPVLDLVLADETNPRALAFQLAAARSLLAEIGGTPSPLAAGPTTPLAAGPTSPLTADPTAPLAAASTAPLAADRTAPLAADRTTPLAALPAALLEEVTAIVAEVLAAPDQMEAAAALPERLRQLAVTIAGLSERINQHYFTLLPVVHLGGPEPARRRPRNAA